MDTSTTILDMVLPRNMLFRETILENFFNPQAEIELHGNAQGIEFTEDERRLSGLATYTPNTKSVWLEIATVYGRELLEEELEHIYASPHISSFEQAFEADRDVPLPVVYLSTGDKYRDRIRGLMFEAALERKEYKTEFIILGSILQSPQTEGYGVMGFTIQVTQGSLCFETEHVIPLHKVDEMLKNGAYVILVERER